MDTEINIEKHEQRAHELALEQLYQKTMRVIARSACLFLLAIVAGVTYRCDPDVRIADAENSSWEAKYYECKRIDEGSK